MSWNFLCADMFPFEDSKTVFVCPYPEKRNHHSFVNISPTLVIDTSMERSSQVLQHGKQQNWFFFKRSKLNFDLCWSTEILYRSQHVSVLTTCTFMFRQLVTIEPSFFKTTSGMHRRSFEGRHLVVYGFKVHL